VGENRWLEVSFIVDTELAEAISEVLARFAPGGIVIENTQVHRTSENLNLATDLVRVCAYILFDDQIEETRQRLNESIWHLSQITPIPGPSFTMIQDTNWIQAWKEKYHPLPIGKNLIIMPSWLEAQNHKRIPIRIEPGMAFGTGTHPTTQLSLELLEKWVQPGLSFIDIGCGSGILSIAATKLGAHPVLGIDIDPQAITNAIQNAKINDLPTEIEFHSGSVEDILAGKFNLNRGSVVVANILTHILIKLLDYGMGDLVLHNGVLLLSGILEEKEKDFLLSLERHNFSPIDRIQMGDWVAMTTKRN
jgi:ribosomal protein L11 methyltransferase